MRTTFFYRIFLVSIAFFMTACGDALMKKSDNQERFSQFANVCESDPKALSKIFVQNVRAELLCLKENLNLFIDVVKTDRPGNLSFQELKVYIEKNVDDLDPQIIEALSGVFDINSLIYGDDRLYINKENVEKLVQLFIDINKAIVENDVYAFFTAKENKISFYEHNRRKAKIFAAFSYIGERLQKEFTERNNKLNLIDLIEKFQNLDDSKILQNFADLLFVKKMFLGGNETELTSAEFKRFSGMIADIGKVAFDVVYMPFVQHSEHQDEEVLLTLKEDTETLVKNLFYKGQDYTQLLTLDNIFDALNIFAPEFSRYKKYTNEILKFKAVILENSTPVFNSNEIMILFDDILLRNLKKGVFFYKMYAMNADVLESGEYVRADLPGLLNSGNNEDFYRDEFNRIIKSYRFFKGSEYSASFNNFIQRNPLGIFEIAVLEDIVKRVFATYGTSSPSALGGYKVSQEQLEHFMLEHKEFLEGENITDPGRTQHTAETITLMSSLFQAQSDGDSDIEVNEIVEFAVELMSAKNMAKIGDEYLQKECQADERGRYAPECYREKFVDLMDVDQDGVFVKDHMNKLYEYLKYSSTDVDEYLQITEVFTRSCTHFDDGEPVPMYQSELFLVMSGLMAIEQTMVKYDLNNDNILQPSEVNTAFAVYENAVRALLPTSFKFLAKKVFLFMIKYQKVPTALEVAKLIVTREKKLKASAQRKTLAILLKTLSMESPANKENPFPCETLR